MTFFIQIYLLLQIIEFEWSPNGKYIAIIYNGSFLSNNEAKPDGAYCAIIFDVSTYEKVFQRVYFEPISQIVWALKKNNESTDGETSEEARSLPHDTLEIPYIDLFTSEKDFFSFLGYEYSKLKPE